MIKHNLGTWQKPGEGDYKWHLNASGYLQRQGQGQLALKFESPADATRWLLGQDWLPVDALAHEVAAKAVPNA